MSKLYDVISRLEEASVPGGNGFDTAFPESDQLPEKERGPWIRIVLFAVVFVVLGGLTVAFAMWWQERLSLQRSPGFSNQPVAVVESPAPVLPVANLPVAAPPPAASSLQTEETQQNSATDAKDISPETMSIDVAETAGIVETIDQILQTAHLEPLTAAKAPSSQGTTIYIRELDIAEAEPNQDQNQTPAQDHSPAKDQTSSTAHYTKIGDDKAKTSRWLHQAELYRRNGEWEGAILLYERVWDISGDPGVANNLAASLIEMNRFEEALKVLEESSVIAPSDPDIKMNLSIVKRILDRQ